MKKLRSIQAFSLVEVVFAMAVIAFCLVVLLGLLSSGLVDSKKSSDDTNVAGIVWQVSNTLRSQTTANLILTTNYYFDVNGQLTNGVTTPYYSCALSKNAANTFSAIPNSTTQNLTSSTFTNLEIQVSYPGHNPTYPGQVPFISYVTIPPP